MDQDYCNKNLHPTLPPLKPPRKVLPFPDHHPTPPPTTSPSCGVGSDIDADRDTNSQRWCYSSQDEQTGVVVGGGGVWEGGVGGHHDSQSPGGRQWCLLSVFGGQ